MIKPTNVTLKKKKEITTGRSDMSWRIGRV